MFMVGRREYLINVVSFTKLQGEAGPLGEGNAPSDCIMLQVRKKLRVMTDQVNCSTQAQTFTHILQLYLDLPVTLSRCICSCPSGFFKITSTIRKTCMKTYKERYSAYRTSFFITWVIKTLRHALKNENLYPSAALCSFLKHYFSNHPYQFISPIISYQQAGQKWQCTSYSCLCFLQVQITVT